MAIDALAKGLQVLACFSAEKSEWGLSELSERLGIYKSRAHRILGTLAQSGFVVRDEGTLRYRLGRQAAALGRVADADAELRDTARPYLVQLGERTKAAIHLRVIRAGANVVIDSIESPLPLRLVRPVGEASPLHYGSSGKALLAFAAPKIVARALAAPVLARFTSRSIVERDLYRKELQHVRRLGYSFTDGEGIAGLRSLAAPVLGADGFALAAVASALPASALPDNEIAAHGRAVAKCAARIAGALRRGRALPVEATA